MSGGSYGYIYSTLLNECENAMYDAEMNDMIKDLAEVLLMRMVKKVVDEFIEEKADHACKIQSQVVHG